MKIDYLNGKIIIETQELSHMNMTIKMTATCTGLVYYKLENLSRDKFIFFEKSDDKYQEEIKKAIENLIVTGENFINDIPYYKGN